MKLAVSQGSIVDTDADTIIVNLIEGDASPGGATGAVDRALGGAVSELIRNGDIKGKLGEVGVVYPRNALKAKRVLITGLGPAAQLNLEVLRQASAHAIKKARDLGAVKVAAVVHGAGIAALDPEACAQAVGEGSLLGYYKPPKVNQEAWDTIETLTLTESDAGKMPAIERAARLAMQIGEAVYRARDLVSWGPNQVTPSYMAEEAGEIAKKFGMKLTVGDREWAEARKMGAFLAVSKAAAEPARFIVLEHNADKTGLDTVVIVGKGITFDTGGISLKPEDKLEEMKSDMAGAAVVLETMRVVGEMDLPLHVVAIAPCTENMPSGRAYHPADILTASNGKTIEVISTDAEGRLILADALVYAQQYKPAAVVDLATLTGSCVIALGEWVAAGLFSTHDWLSEQLLASAERTHERLWRLPLWDDYKRKIASTMADMANSGGRHGGVGGSAIFLKEFTDYPWAHLDIAGMALIDKLLETPYTPFGATGYGVRLMVDFLRNWKPVE